jgi:GxxExxY protein
MREEINRCTGRIIKSAMRVHTALGPGLLESAYQVCLRHEFRLCGLYANAQVEFPVEYRGVQVKVGYRADFVVEQLVIVELKAVTKTLPVHEAQLLSYLRMSGLQVGLLINFHAVHLRDGITRLANRF